MNCVSVLIATRDRHHDLAETLKQLQACRSLISEVIVVDDGSRNPVEPVVRREWPEARLVRHESSAGQCRRRSEGFKLCQSPWILQLDDDSAPVGANALSEACNILRRQSEVAIVAFHIFNGQEIPSGHSGAGGARYTASFVGCGALIRTEAVMQTGGYTTFFGNEWEEEELALRVMKAGYALYYDPSLVVHHRVSQQNRRSDRTWMRGFRNKLWSLLMHFPARRVITDGAWVLAVACWDAIRMLRFRWFALGLWQFAAGLPRAMKLRRPISSPVMARYDALRFRAVTSKADFDSPPAVRAVDAWRWFTQSWWTRARQRSFWDRRAGDVGTSSTVVFAHNTPPRSCD